MQRSSRDGNQLPEACGTEPKRPNEKDFCSCRECLRWDPARRKRDPRPGGRRSGPGVSHRLTAGAATSGAAEPRRLPIRSCFVLRAPGASARRRSASRHDQHRHARAAPELHPQPARAHRLPRPAHEQDSRRRGFEISPGFRSTCSRTAPRVTHTSQHFLVAVAPPRTQSFSAPAAISSAFEAVSRATGAVVSARAIESLRYPSSDSRRSQRCHRRTPAACAPRPLHHHDRRRTGSSRALRARPRGEVRPEADHPAQVHLEANTSPRTPQLTTTPRRPHSISHPRGATLCAVLQRPLPGLHAADADRRRPAEDLGPVLPRRSCWSSRPSPPRSFLSPPDSNNAPVLTGRDLRRPPAQRPPAPAASRRRPCSRPPGPAPIEDEHGDAARAGARHGGET